MPIQRPQFQQLSVTELQQKLDKLSTLMEQSKTAQGDVDLRALEAKVDAAGDPALKSTFERVQHDHLRKHQQLVLANSETNPHWRVRQDPDVAILHAIPAGEVHAVMSSLVAAKIAVAEADNDHDGRLSRNEVLEARDEGAVGSSQGVADALLEGSTDAFDQALHRWLAQSPRSASEVRMRQRLHDQIEYAVEAKVQTPAGQEAARWYLREKVMGARLNPLDGNLPDKTLRKADSSFWTRLFGASGKHLDDQEIAKLVGTSDLSGFVQQAKQRVEQALQGPFTEAWLDGLNIGDPSSGRDPGYLFRPLPS
jgi:hypothetical protein